MITKHTSNKQKSVEYKLVYSKPVLKKEGTLKDLTQGFAGSVPDEDGGHTKRNPFQG